MAPGYRVFDAGTVAERRTLVRRALGVTGLGIDQFDSTPGRAGSEHDER